MDGLDVVYTQPHTLHPQHLSDMEKRLCAFLVEKIVVMYILHPVRTECTNHNLETLNANFLGLNHHMQ
jgi:hypothetical protein